MRKKLIALLTVLAALVLAGEAMAVSTTTTCKTVSTVTTLISAHPQRLGWSIVTTSGAATIYFRADGGNATLQGAGSSPLTGGQSYSENKGAASTEKVTVLAVSSAWVCAQETY